MIVRFEDLSDRNNGRVRELSEAELISMKETMTCEFDEITYRVRDVIEFTSHVAVLMLPKLGESNG